MTAPGWYSAEGDPPGTQRYWDGAQWTGEPVAVSAPPPAFEPPHMTTPLPMVPQTPMGGPGAAGGYQAQAPAAHRTRRVAEVGDRIVGRLIDIVIGFAFVVGLVFLDLGGSTNFSVLETTDVQFRLGNRALDTSLEYAIFVLFSFVWSVGWIHLKGGTPGKLIMKMRVADAATGQSPVNLMQACLRSANYLLPILGVASVSAGNTASTVLGIVALASFVMLLADSEHRTIMDRIGKTVILKQ